MKITINDQQSISQLSDSFNELFPFLKLEFFSKRHKTGEPSPMQYLINKNLMLKDCRKGNDFRQIIIEPNMAVSELEQLLWTQYGLGVQVFRKSGNVWLETTLTDAWTLDEQNKEGEYLSKKNEPDQPGDYHEQE